MSAAAAPLAIVLAGGRSRRMGTSKAGVLLGGRPVAAWALDAAAHAGRGGNGHLRAIACRM